MDGFWNWLIGEAGAGWIIGLLGVIGGLIAWLRRERPSRIIVQKMGSRSLLSVHESQRDRLKIEYRRDDDTAVDVNTLYQSEFKIYNAGSRNIEEEVAVGLHVTPIRDSGNIPFVRYVLEHDGSEDGVMEREVASDSSEIEISLPYLNSYRVHRDFWTLYVVSDRAIQTDLVRRTGKGWSAMTYSGTLDEKMDINLDEKMNLNIWIILTLTQWISGIIALVGLIPDLIASFNSPMVRFRLSRTPENIEASIETWANLVRTTPDTWWERIKYFFLLPSGPSHMSWWTIAAFIVFGVLIVAKVWLVERLLEEWIGIVPSNRFG